MREQTFFGFLFLLQVWSFSIPNVNNKPGNDNKYENPFSPRRQPAAAAIQLDDGIAVQSLLKTKRPNNEEIGDEESTLVCYDAIICGAGPAGLLMASHLKKEGLDVAVVDPALDKPWPNNYGVWVDEAMPFGYMDCLDAVWKEVGIVFDEETPELVLNRPYGRVDRKKMKAKLLSECCSNNANSQEEGSVHFACAKAVNVQHFDEKPSIVTIRENRRSSSVVDDQERFGKSKDYDINAITVIDCTGFSREFVKHDVKFDPGFQVTYGARYKVRDIGPYELNRMVLMDYSEKHLYDDPELVKDNNRFPSFVYVMPLKEDEIFLEETILVSRPGGSSKNLQQRLEKRMKALGIEPIKVLEDERAAIPMGGADPVVPQRTVGFGATSSLIHPASGYMVARAMEIAPRVATEIASPIKQLRSKLERLEKNNDEIVVPRSSLDGSNELDRISKIGWDSIWPADERRQRDFMNFGFELLCLLDPQELRDFFTGFFRLPNGLWEHFLSWRLSGVGHIAMGLIVWAKCIPKRFMSPMLIKSIPFIGNRLVGPFLSRSSPSEIFTDSLYWDARSKDSKIWEPEQFFPYLDRLVQKSYGDVEMGRNSDTKIKEAEKSVSSASSTTTQQIQILGIAEEKPKNDKQMSTTSL